MDITQLIPMMKFHLGEIVVRNKDNILRTCEMQNGEEHTREKFT